MKFFAHLAGNIFAALILINSFAHATEYEYRPAFYHEYDWAEIGTWAGLTTAGIIAITQFDNSEAIFAGVYGGVGLYYLNEKINKDDQFEYEDYVIPLGLATMALTNLTLLKQEDESKSTIAFYNTLGTGLMGIYWYYYEGPAAKNFVMPWTDGKSTGLAMQAYF